MEINEFIYPSPFVQDGQEIVLKVKTKLSNGWQRVTTHRVLMFAAVRSDSPITNDGDLSEWNNAIPFYLNHPSQIKMMPDWGGPEDLSGKGYLKWDENNIYIAAEVIDNSFHQMEFGEEIWKGDSIQFALDFELSRDPKREGHHEIGYAINYNKIIKWRWISAYGKPIGSFNEGKIAIIQRYNKMIYEIEIPWSSLLPENRKIKSKDKIGFAFLINDNDGYGRRGWIEYMQGIGRTKDPNLLGEVILSY